MVVLTSRPTAAVLFWSACAAAALAQPPAEPQDRAAAERLAYMQAAAAEYEVTLAGDASAPLPFHSEPLLRFNNTVSGVPDGIIVMWKQGVRPAVFARMFQTKGGAWIHECQSLASAPLVMRREGQVRWQPQTAAESFKPLPEARPPADSAAARLRQMRDLAREFSSSDDFKIDPSDAEPTRHQLRLLPNPIYRYADLDAGIVDAAVFAFVHGTDPEVFLVLEARSSNGASAWHYTLAPMTCWAVEARRDGDVVWHLPERFGKSSAQGLYHVWMHAQGAKP